MITDRETAIRALRAGNPAEALRVLTCKHESEEETREDRRRNPPGGAVGGAYRSDTPADFSLLTKGATHCHFRCDLCGCMYYRAF